jgi:putative DNA primase/helicase
VNNGVIDLRTGALTTGRPDDLLTRAIDLDYDPHATCPRFEEFVREVSDSDEVADFLQRTFGYAITGNSFEQFIWVFTGPGRNGKGVLFSTIGDILGPYYHEISRAMLVEQKNEQSPASASEHKYSLLGKRIIVGAETNKGQKIDSSAIKSLTGEDRIVCRPLFKSEIVFKPTHTLFLHTHHIPAGLTKDFALVQRLLKIDFPYMYVDDPDAEGKKYPARAGLFRRKDPHLKEALRKERQGILAWLVRGCLAWQEQGLSPPESILSGVDTLAREEDYIGQFMEDCLEPHPDKDSIRMSCTRLHEAFRWWWAQNMDNREQRVPGIKSVNNAIRDRGHLVDKSGGKTWLYRHTLALSIEGDVDDWLKKGAKS